MAALTNEQYATVLKVYDEVHDGLAWSARDLAWVADPGSQWDDQQLDGVYRVDDETLVGAEAVNDSYHHNLREAGIDLVTWHEASKRMARENR